MNVAVRYFSQFGRTKTIAEEMADELGVEAISITDEPTLTEHVDVLFLGGAPYLSVMDAALDAYASDLTPDMVGCVVLFTTSNWSHRTALGLRVKLEEHGITVAPGHFYAHMAMIEQRKAAAREFARNAVAKAQEANTTVTPVSHAKELAVEVVTVLGIAAVVVASVAVTRRMRARLR